jgi:hypothetical protein
MTLHLTHHSVLGWLHRDRNVIIVYLTVHSITGYLNQPDMLTTLGLFSLGRMMFLAEDLFLTDNHHLTLDQGCLLILLLQPSVG